LPDLKQSLADVCEVSRIFTAAGIRPPGGIMPPSPRIMFCIALLVAELLHHFLHLLVLLQQAVEILDRGARALA
jgi:hypothetical protein